MINNYIVINYIPQVKNLKAVAYTLAAKAQYHYGFDEI